MPTRIQRKASLHGRTSKLSVELRFWDEWSAHEPFLLALCRQWTKGCDIDPQELLSAGMLHAFEGAHRQNFEIVHHRAWFAMVLRNYCIDLQRKQSRQRQMMVDPELLVTILDQQVKQTQISVEGNLIKEEAYQNLLGKVDGLPKGLREVMVLRACQNLSYQEIGRKLQISSENARKRVELARKRLRKAPFVADFERLPLDEQAAVESVLACPQIGPMAERWAQPICLKLENGHPCERVVFLQSKPMRMAQKSLTLQKYIQKHPSGWKKELEYAQHSYTRGDLAATFKIFESLMERQPTNSVVNFGYLKLLATLKKWESLKDAATICLQRFQDSGEIEEIGILKGFLAFSEEDFGSVVAYWEQENFEPFLGLFCWALKRAGRQAEAIHILKSMIREKPMERSYYFYLIGVETSFDELVSYAETCFLRFGDAFAKGIYLLAGFRMGKALQEEVKLLREIEALAPNSWLNAVCKWAKKRSATQVDFEDLLRKNPNFEASDLQLKAENFPDMLGICIEKLVFP